MEQVDIPIYLYERVYKYKSIWGCGEKKQPPNIHHHHNKNKNHNHTTPAVAQKVWFSVSEENSGKTAAEAQANP